MNIMNPVIMEVVKSVVRYLLAALAGWLLFHGVIDEDLSNKMVSELTSILVGLVVTAILMTWSIVKTKASARFKRNLALAGADKNMTNAGDIVTNAVVLQKSGSDPGPIEGKMTPKGPTAIVGIIMALFLVGNIACSSNPDSNTNPDKIAAATAKYATDAINFVELAQNGINAYAVQQGGRNAQTDAVSYGIKNQVLPAAQQLSTVLRTYATTGVPDVRKASEADIAKALAAYEAAVTDVLGPGKLPDGVAGQLATTVVRIRDLIANIRVLFGSFKPAPTPA